MNMINRWTEQVLGASDRNKLPSTGFKPQIHISYSSNYLALLTGIFNTTG
uniref:Uncharacterized protein n=1 Tax=Arion vulgaris TaxID=1028688 RepID=A0A0B6YRV2_9EUPU